MIKSVATGLCVLAISGTLAFAQSSQGQAGANTGPTSPTAQNTHTGAMNANARMMSKKMMMMKKKRMMMMKKKRMMMMKKKKGMM